MRRKNFLKAALVAGAGGMDLLFNRYNNSTTPNDSFIQRRQSKSEKSRIRPPGASPERDKKEQYYLFNGAGPGSICFVRERRCERKRCIENFWLRKRKFFMKRRTNK